MATLKTYTISTDVTGGVVDAVDLNLDIANSGYVTGFSGINITGDSMDIIGTSFANEALCDTLIQDHIAVTLDEYKQAKYNAIDYKTGALLSVGFTYDSKVFSLSANAQLNWSEIHSNIAEFPDPVDVTMINNDTYGLAHANVNTFWTTAKDILKGHLDSGRALKKTVFDAVDKAAVDAVIDNR